MHRFLLALLSFSFVSSHLLAASPCDAPQTALDIFKCIQTRHPDVLRTEAELSGGPAYAKAAGQRINPELEADTLVGSKTDQPSFQVEAKLRHTFETGGKRNRRIDQARQRETLQIANANTALEQVTLRAVLDLHRLRQLASEMAAVDESLHTFQKVIGQFQGRRRLGAEQDVSLSVFRLAEGDYHIRKARLLQERAVLLTTLQLATQLPVATIERAAPLAPPTWPQLEEVDTSELAGAQWHTVNAEQAIVNASVNSAKAEAIPDVAVGPRAVLTRGHGFNDTEFGASLEMRLPVYHRNRGAIAVSENELRIANLNRDLTERELRSRRSAYREVYRISVESLAKAPDLKRIENQHQQTESLFERGLVSASLVIESHRQLTEFLADQHEQELQALNALWNLYAIDGRMLLETL